MNNSLTKNFFGSLILAAACLLMIQTAPAQQVLNGSVRDVDEAQQPPQAQQQAPVQEPKSQVENGSREILVVSGSDIDLLSAGKYLRHFKNADAALSRNITNELREHGLSSRPTPTADDRQPLLTYKIESLEFGFKTPFGRHTRLTVSYAFQKKPGDAVISGKFVEHSKKGWKNCVKAVSESIAGDVSMALGGKAEMISQKKRTDDKRPEERLEQLDALKAKGMVTDEEYRKKREEILRDL